MAPLTNGDLLPFDHVLELVDDHFSTTVLQEYIFAVVPQYLSSEKSEGSLALSNSVSGPELVRWLARLL